MAKVTPFPDAVEDIPVPPNRERDSESRSIDISVDPSETSRSCAVTVASTYAFIDCCDAAFVAELDAILSSSKKADPERDPFNTGLVSVLFVSVAVVPET